MDHVHLACGSQYRRAAAILGDYVAHAPRRFMARLWARLGLPTYSFHFKAATTGIPINISYGLGPGFANHGAELAYEMGLPVASALPSNSIRRLRMSPAILLSPVK